MPVQHVEPSPEPPLQNNPVPRWWDSESDVGGGPYEFMPTSSNESRRAQSHDSATLEGAPQSEKPANQRGESPFVLWHGSASNNAAEDNTGVTDAIPPVQAARARAEMNGNGTQPTSANANGTSGLPMAFTRRPVMTPVLLPEYRYCFKEGFVKPPRAHHCRACGTVSQ